MKALDFSKISCVVSQSSFNSSDLEPEENLAVSFLPDILSHLDVLCIGESDDEYICLDVDFARELFVFYRYLWLILGIIQDNPRVDFSSVFGAYPNLELYVKVSDCPFFNEEDHVSHCHIQLFQWFMCNRVSEYAESYRHFLLTGEIVVTNEFCN
jgi:hypothetical protein